MDTILWPIAVPPVVVRAGRYPFDDRTFEHRYHGPTHALHCHRYTGRIRTVATTVGLEPGDVTCSPAGHDSWYDLDAPGHHWCIHFHPVASRGRCLRIPLWQRPVAIAGFVQDRFAHIAALIAEGGALAAIRANAAFHDLLLALGTDPDQVLDTSGPAPEERAAAFMATRLDTPLDVPAVARAVGMSQDHLAKRFRRCYGATMQAWHRARRLAHAAALLADTDMPVGRIAARLGFADAQHFNKRFRQQTGESPTAWRARGGRPGGSSPPARLS